MSANWLAGGIAWVKGLFRGPEQPPAFDWPAARALEQEEVERRRTAEGVPPGAPLSGLAFSGGGIRSATFGLGVLEALRDLDALRRFDYYSSVSGGGYIIGWLRAHCVRQGRLWLTRQATAAWDDSIRHLSRFSNYLSPQLGFMSADTWTMLTIWARNAILVQLTIVALIAIILLLPRVAVNLFSAWWNLGDVRWVSIILFSVAVTGIAGNQLQQRRQPVRYLPWRDLHWRYWSVFAAMLAGLVALLWWRSGFQPFVLGPVGPMAFPIATLLLLAAVACLPGLARSGMFGRGSDGLRSGPDYGQGAVQVLVVLPMLVTSVLLGAVLWEFVNAGARIGLPDSYGGIVAEGWRLWPFPLSFAFGSLVILSACSLDRWHGRKLLLRTPVAVFNVVLVVVASAACIGALHAMFSAVVLLLQLFVAMPGGQWLAFIWAPSLLLLAFAGAVTLMIGLLGRASLESMREWWSRLGAWLCIYAFAWNVVVAAAFYGPFFVAWLVDFDDWKKVASVIAWAGTTLGGLFAANSSATKGDTKIRSREPTLASRLLGMLAAVAPVLFIAGLLVLIATVLHVVLAHASGLTEAGVLAGFLHTTRAAYWGQMYVGDGVLYWTLAGLCAVALLLVMRVDINEFSLNAFYRSRLVRCYLGASRTDRHPQAFTQFDEDDDLPVAAEDRVAAAGAPYPAPLHIINCTLDLGGSKDLSLHTRHGASLTITPQTIGTAYPLFRPEGAIGYRRHAYYEHGRSTGLSLGEAIAVSGAAASPNQGFHTSPAVAFLMTMFNARLGRWLPNPRHGNVRRSSPRLSLRYLVMELFGVADERSDYLMVSDGGHFENLGAYELVRRECRLIVVSDAECDPVMRFEALGTLIRMCKVDFNVRIELDVRALQIDDATGFSGAHYAVGPIIYPTGQPGLLIYLKASLTAAIEDASVLQYHASHPAFPQESTGDQFYGEDQFESYRRLGRHIAKQAFGGGFNRADAALLQRVWPGFTAAVLPSPPAGPGGPPPPPAR